MRTSRQVLLAPALLVGALAASAFAANAQVSTTADAAPPHTVPISTLIAAVARETGRKFVLDPRVQAKVTLAGENPASVTYDQLLTILDTYGFTTIDTGGYFRVVPLAEVRDAPLPLVSDNDTLPGDQYVAAVFHVRSLPAGWLIPILRPMVPQWGHLVAMPCDNSLIIVDRFANVRLLESIVKALDTGAPIKPPTCIVPMPRPWRSGGPLPPAPPPRRPAP